MATPVKDTPRSKSCETCERLRERLHEVRAELDRVKDNAEGDINALALQLAKATQELERLRRVQAGEKSELTKRDKEAYEFWLAAHGKDPAKKVNAFGPAAQSALNRARKYGLTQEDILKVIGTQARYPFLVFGRWSATGSRNDRKDGLAHAFKDEGRWNALLTLADAPPPTTHDRRSEPRKGPWNPPGYSEPPNHARAARLERGRDPIVEFIDALEVHHSSPHVSYNGQGNALCPAHDDTQKSLRFKEGDDGRVLVHCMSHNCTPEAITAALGLSLADLFPNRKEPA